MRDWSLLNVNGVLERHQILQREATEEREKRTGEVGRKDVKEAEVNQCRDLNQGREIDPVIERVREEDRDLNLHHQTEVEGHGKIVAALKAEWIVPDLVQDQVEDRKGHARGLDRLGSTRRSIANCLIFVMNDFLKD